MRMARLRRADDRLGGRFAGGLASLRLCHRQKAVGVDEQFVVGVSVDRRYLGAKGQQ